MITETCADMVRGAGCAFDCMTFDDLAVATARRVGATLMIRGLRDGTDLDYEMQLAGMNAAMAPEVQTVFLPASPPRSSHHRHPGPADRRHGRRRLGLRAGRGGRPPQEEVCGQSTELKHEPARRKPEELP